MKAIVDVKKAGEEVKVGDILQIKRNGKVRKARVKRWWQFWQRKLPVIGIAKYDSFQIGKVHSVEIMVSGNISFTRTKETIV